MPRNPGEQPQAPPQRVALIDCYAHDRTFVREPAFRNLSARLDGEVRFFQLIAERREGGETTDAVLSAVKQFRPELIVMSRTWSVDLLNEVRAASEGAVVVRYTNGAPAALDDRFDAVLDADGVVALVAGEAFSQPRWRRTKAELRAGNDEALASTGAIPTISGPAKGCPFLVDVRSSPAYASTDIDFNHVQTKGCAFCLDNVGAYAAFPESVVVDTWLGQLRNLRTAEPSCREILLTDERPHPYLPALFHAIAADPALHGIELLIKSRVDWLAEFADTALRQACELAAKSGSVVHVYLVGFESFHQPDLDLFNKAVTVEDNLRAVDLLYALEARHPDTFEFRRHRAHGIVLFHPWTTPESLLDNAAAMRAIDFEKLRGQALQTRLRLYASVPLHALAERQGLLVERFEAGRGDRAVEQGYDASLPWRFADPRIEAIFEAAHRLATRLSDLTEADVLEMATRFVQRWPAFAAAPELAALPLLYSPYAWGSSPADVLRVAGAALASYDPEVEAVAAGSKRACLKEAVASEDAASLVGAYRQMGLAAAVVSSHDRGDDDGRHRPGDSHVMVAVARDAQTLADVLAHQRAVESGEAQSIAVMGEHLGYPPCCIAAFAELREQGTNLALEVAPFLRQPTRALDPWLNRFGAVSLLSHHLCAPNCHASATLAQRRLESVRALDQSAAARIRSHLEDTFLRLDYRRAASVRGEWDDHRFRLDEFIPFLAADFGFNPAAARSLRFAPGGVTFTLADEREHFVSGPQPLLVRPGYPIAPEVLEVIADSPPATPPPATPPSLEIVLAVGSRVGELTISAFHHQEDGFRVELRRADGGSVQVRLWRWRAGVETLARRGGWAIDLEPPQPPSPEELAVVRALARILPEGGHGQHESPPRPAQTVTRKLPMAGEVTCTAPWTTLEVVDPDGRTRQCCADWTAGDRGNIHQQSLTDIWNGAGYQWARRVMSGSEIAPLCHAICPRLYDRKFAGSQFSVIRGAAPFMANQQRLLEDIAAHREVVRGRPLFVAVCPSTYCNYDCIMCLHGRSPRRDLPESIWDELAELLPTLRVLTLLGGEPLANPLAMKFLRQWDAQRYPDAMVSIVTNGSLLGPTVLKHLEGCRFAGVTVSLNAGTPEVYEQVQRGIALSEVLANIDALVELRRRTGRDFPIILSFVVQPANHATLPAFVELAHRRGLPIRLLPLSPRGPEGLDFYGDADQVARILASLDATAAWASASAPHFLAELRATRTAIATEAQMRQPTAARFPEMIG